MNYDTLRDLDRDPILYQSLRNAMLSHCKEANISSYADFFADKLRYTSKTRSTQLLGSIQDHSTRKFSLDEFAMVIRELGLSAAPVVNRLVEQCSLVCIPLSSTSPDEQVDFNSFSLKNSVINGALSAAILDSLSDGVIDKKERFMMLSEIAELIGILVELREQVELTASGENNG
jgi:hypothetical protein